MSSSKRSWKRGGGEKAIKASGPELEAKWKKKAMTVSLKNMLSNVRHKCVVEIFSSELCCLISSSICLIKCFRPKYVVEYFRHKYFVNYFHLQYCVELFSAGISRPKYFVKNENVKQTSFGHLKIEKLKFEKMTIGKFKILRFEVWQFETLKLCHIAT